MKLKCMSIFAMQSTDMSILYIENLYEIVNIFKHWYIHVIYIDREKVNMTMNI